MSVRIIRDVPGLASETLPDLGPVRRPVSEAVSRLRGLEVETRAGSVESGIWECTPGRWIRTITRAEIAQFLVGSCTFRPDGGDEIRIRAGDLVYFPENTGGEWHIEETVRKVYFLFDETPAT